MSSLLAENCQYVAEAILQGKLYEVDGYPGAVESADPNDRVYGELYRMGDGEAVLARLDDYEECSLSFPEPHEYVRKQLLITVVGGDRVMAWVYIFNRDVSRLTPIESGDYISYRSG